MSEDRRGMGDEGAGEAADRLAEMHAGDAVGRLDGGVEGTAMPSPSGITLAGPVAEAFFWCDDPVVGIQGPVGSGKTRTTVLSRVRRALMMPRSTIDGVRRYKLLVARETYRQLWSTTIPSYLEVIPRAAGPWSGGRGDPVTHAVTWEDEHGPVEWVAEFVAYGDNISDSMRGAQTVDLWANEGDTQDVQILTTGIGRIDRWPGRQHFAGYPPELRSYGQIVTDFNAPDDEENWTVRVFHDQAERERLAREMNRELPDGARPIRISFFRQPGGRDPAAENIQNLAPGYYQTQVTAMTLAGRGDMIARMVDNKIAPRKIGQPVFGREFSPSIHVSPTPIPPDPALPLRIGLDQGLTPAAVIAQFRPPLHWTVLAELMMPSEHILARAFGEKLADLIDARFPNMRIEAAWGDVAGEATSAQAEENETWNRIVGRAVGVAVRPQRIGANRIQPRLEAVRSALEYLSAGRPGLLIDPSCRYLRRGFEARYVWADEIDASGNKRKVPNKKIVEANAMDALQYLLLSEVRGDGTSPAVGPRPSATARRGTAAKAGGLRTGWSTSDPYGGA